MNPMEVRRILFNEDYKVVSYMYGVIYIETETQITQIDECECYYFNDNLELVSCKLEPYEVEIIRGKCRGYI